MKERMISTASLLLLATPFCYANGYTIAVANGIIVVLIAIVIVLVVMGSYILNNNRLIRQRNEQLRRILTALDDYRALVSDDKLAPVEQKEAKAKEPDQIFFVKMDARVNKERPFTDPDFDQEALIQFMGVSHEEFCKLVPRYTDPDRTLDYINSLRAEHAAKILMEHPDYSTADIASQCGFRDTAAFNKAFKFSFGITPTDYLNSMSRMFKEK